MSAWEQFGSEEEFEQELRAIMPYAGLARTILGLRAQRDLTQQQLADLVGTTQSVIARLESGEHEVRIGILNRIADALGLRWRVAFEDRAAATNVVEAANTFAETWGVHVILPLPPQVSAQAGQGQAYATEPPQPPRLALAS